MRLLIISHTEHYLRNGQTVGWGATVREIDYLATRFEDIVHIAPLHTGPAPGGALPYASNNVRLRFVRPSGGRRVWHKLRIWLRIFGYVRVMLRELRRADVVHVRCPANISLIAIVLLTLVRRPRLRWVKYAGNWSPSGREPLSYRFQRWWLRNNLHRGNVTVSGKWPRQAAHVHTLFNPCLTAEEIVEGYTQAERKQLGAPVRLLFVGRVEKAKGAGRILEIASLLEQAGLDFALDVVGGGRERSAFEARATGLGLSGLVTFHGELPRLALAPFYARSHIILLPSRSEGWPKVLSEAMAYGVVPLASNVGSIPFYLSLFGTGKSLSPDDVQRFAAAILSYYSYPEIWRREAKAGLGAVGKFSYENYLREIARLLEST